MMIYAAIWGLLIFDIFNKEEGRRKVIKNIKQRNYIQNKQQYGN